MPVASRRHLHTGCAARLTLPASSLPVLTSSHGTHDETRTAGPTRARDTNCLCTHAPGPTRNPIARLHIEASGHAPSEQVRSSPDTCHAGYKRRADVCHLLHNMVPTPRDAHATGSDDTHARADSTGARAGCSSVLERWRARNGAPRFPQPTSRIA